MFNSFFTCDSPFFCHRVTEDMEFMVKIPDPKNNKYKFDAGVAILSKQI